jgi:NAD(P)-dependent dehydrogenase (short-subunit alcohol dehydrogenase family)
LQLAFGTSYKIRLARLLAAQVDPEVGGRLAALRSIVGSHKPMLTLAPYSLSKAAMEATVRLLAPELARKRITVDAVCRSFIAVGITSRTAFSSICASTKNLQAQFSYWYAPYSPSTGKEPLIAPWTSGGPSERGNRP